MKKILMVLLILIIILSSVISTYSSAKCKTKEGYVDYNMTNPDMIKDVRVIPETERLMVMNDIYKSVRNHEKLFSVYDKTYEYKEITQNPKSTIVENIYNLFSHLRRHDNELIKLTKNDVNYVPGSTLDGLIDGSLLKSLRDDLYKIKNYKGSSMMAEKTTDPNKMMEQAKQYEDASRREPNGEVRKDLIEEANQRRFDVYKKKIQNDPPDDANVPRDDAPIITQEEIEARLEMMNLYHISKVVEYQDEAVKGIYNVASNYFKESHSM